MFALASLVVLAATPAFKLATPGLSYANLDEKTGAAFLDYFAQQIGASGRVQVTTPAELAAVMGLERQKQLLACSESSNTCLTELAGAIGADGLITGSLAKAGHGYLVNLKIVSTRDAHTLAVFSQRVKDEDALVEFLGTSARALVKQLAPESPEPVAAPAAVVEPVPTASRAWVVPAALGGALLAGGAVALGLAQGQGSALQSGSPSIQTPAQLQSVRSAGETEQAVGLALGGVGLASLAVAGGFWFAGDAPRKAWWLPIAGGGAAALVAGIFFGLAKSDEGQLRSGSSSLSTVDQVGRLRSSGSMDQTASGVLAVGAVVGVGAGLGLRLLGGDAQLSLAPAQGGAAVGLGGTF